MQINKYYIVFVFLTFYRTWVKSTGEQRDITDIPPVSLDGLVGTYLKTAKFRGKNGEEKDYEPDSLTSIHRSIDRYLKQNGYQYSLITSKEFEVSKLVLETRRKELKSQGKGNRPNRADAITPAEEEKLWEKGQLGSSNPSALQNTINFFNGQLLGYRGSDESRQLEWGDIILTEDENGSEFLQWNERKSKTRSGQPRSLRPFQPKIFANSSQPERCPVTNYKLFASHRPKKSLEPHAPFYLAINHTRREDAKVWYKNSPMGEKLLGAIVKTMCVAAGIPGKKTNHSIRKTMCTNLFQAGVNPILIAQLAGHKNVASVNNYAVASLPQQKQMCRILSNSNQSVTMQDLPSVTQLALPAPASTSQDSGPSNEIVAQPRSSMISNSQCYEKTSSSSSNRSSGPFSGAVIHGGHIEVHIHNHNHGFESENSKGKAIKRRRIMIDSDDSD